MGERPKVMHLPILCLRSESQRGLSWLVALLFVGAAVVERCRRVEGRICLGEVRREDAVLRTQKDIAVRGVKGKIERR